MAKATLSYPFDSISGKLNSTDKKIVMRTRNGRPYTTFRGFIIGSLIHASK